jgi:hypothetical protein
MAIIRLNPTPLPEPVPQPVPPEPHELPGRPVPPALALSIAGEIEGVTGNVSVCAMASEPEPGFRESLRQRRIQRSAAFTAALPAAGFKTQNLGIRLKLHRHRPPRFKDGHSIRRHKAVTPDQQRLACKEMAIARLCNVLCNKRRVSSVCHPFMRAL